MKALFLSAALVAASLGANAQFSVGIQPEAGLNLASLRQTVNDEKTTSSTQANFHAGVAVNLGLGEQLAIQPGIYYSVKGGTFKDPFGAGSGNYEYKFDYVQIPVNVVYHFNNNQSGFFLLAGAYAAAAVRAKVKLPNATEQKLEIGGDEAKDDIRRWDIGFNGGAGYQLAMGLTLKAQYQLGAMNIIQHNNSAMALRNSNIAISVGYRIGGK